MEETLKDRIIKALLKNRIADKRELKRVLAEIQSKRGI